eukprot:2222754-Rhodomonas_salina.1
MQLASPHIDHQHTFAHILPETRLVLHLTCLPHVELGFVDSSYLQQIEGRGVEEPEGNEIEDPATRVHSWV